MRIAATIATLATALILAGCPKAPVDPEEPATAVHRYSIYTCTNESDCGIFESDDCRIVDGCLVATIAEVVNKLPNRSVTIRPGDVVTLSPPFVVYDHAQNLATERGEPLPPNGGGRPR